MGNLLQSWDKLPANWERKKIIVFLDYDGTLTPIAAVPSLAVLAVEVKQLLAALTVTPSCQVVIISGRALADVKALVGIEGIDYVGNHGWEIDGPHIRFESLIPPAMRTALEAIGYELSAKLSAVSGAIVEDKGITVSVHYRLVPQPQVSHVRSLFEHTCRPYVKQKMVRTQEGKKVLEARPALDWDKGKAALWFLKKEQAKRGEHDVLPFCLGDDRTDEDAFIALRGKGITVYVGEPRRTNAQYSLSGPQEVAEFLRLLISRLNARDKPQ